MKYKYIIDTKLIAYYLIQRGRPISDIFNKIAELVYGLKKKGDIYLCFDIGHSDFREEEQSYYKGHRRAAMKKRTPQEQVAHELFNETYAKLPFVFRGLGSYVVAVPGVEADDLASIISEQYKNQPDARVTLITGDYDWLHMVSGTNNVRMYDFSKDKYWHDSTVRKVYGVTSRREFSVRKSITGDKSDNIKFVRNLAEIKGTALFETIREKYGDPTNDEIIDMVVEYINDNPHLKVHEFHVKDGRKTVRDAFLSNIKIADPFTSTEQLTKIQKSQVDDILSEESPITLSSEGITSKMIELFGYPIVLTDVAKKVYNVNSG